MTNCPDELLDRAMELMIPSKRKALDFAWSESLLFPKMRPFDELKQEFESELRMKHNGAKRIVDSIERPGTKGLSRLRVIEH